MPTAEKGQVPPLSYYFSSVGHHIDGHVCALKEVDEAEDARLIFKKTKGRGATNSTMLELPKVTMIEK